MQTEWIERRRWPSSCPRHLSRCAVAGKSEAGKKVWGRVAAAGRGGSSAAQKVEASECRQFSVCLPRRVVAGEKKALRTSPLRDGHWEGCHARNRGDDSGEMKNLAR